MGVIIGKAPETAAKKIDRLESQVYKLLQMVDLLQKASERGYRLTKIPGDKKKKSAACLSLWFEPEPVKPPKISDIAITGLSWEEKWCALYPTTILVVEMKDESLWELNLDKTVTWTKVAYNDWGYDNVDDLFENLHSETGVTIFGAKRIGTARW